MSRIAIVGAGVAGLAAAWSLRSHPVETTIFEKSRGYAGRAATRGRYGVRYDHGANFIKPDGGRVRDLLTDALPSDDLVSIGRPVWTFDGDGEISPNGEEPAAMWTYRNGISTVGKLLARRGSAMIHTETRIESLERRNGAWHLDSEEGDRYGPFDAVLLTPPAPQSADLLKRSGMDADLCEELVDGLHAARYTAQFTVVLGYEREIPRSGDYYGLLGTDEDHPIAWIGFEQDKPGHVPDGRSVLIIQTAPKWTAARVEADPDTVMPDVKEAAAEVLGADLTRPSWYDTQRWRYALPTQPADTDQLAAGRTAGLFFAGDFVAESGRVDRSIESGLRAAGELREWV